VTPPNRRAVDSPFFANCTEVTVNGVTLDLTHHVWLHWSRQVFHTAQLYLIYGTGSSDPAYNDLMRERARFIANTAYYQGRAAITILDDTHPLVDQLITSDEKRSNVCVAVF
jgi:hypothetical protein